jgi:hypothetical protein
MSVVEAPHLLHSEVRYGSMRRRFNAVSCRPRPASRSSATCMMSERMEQGEGGYNGRSASGRSSRISPFPSRCCRLHHTPSSLLLVAISRALAEPATFSNVAPGRVPVTPLSSVVLLPHRPSLPEASATSACVRRSSWEHTVWYSSTYST